MSAPGPSPAARKRASGCGCSGCFGILFFFFLVAFSAANVAALWWLDPSWLDRVAFWKGTRVQQDRVTLVAANDPRASDGIYLPEKAAAPIPLRTKPTRNEFFQASAQYDPARGAVLAIGEGGKAGRFEVPPGALPRPIAVTLTPVTVLPDAMAASFAGPAYDFRAGTAEHVTFAKPATLTAPYDPALAAGKRLYAAVWVDGKGWVPLPTTIDAARGTVTARVPHASILGIITGVVVGGTALLGTRPGAWLWERGSTTIGNVSTAGSNVLRTENFAIHYYATGDLAVPSDETYAPGRAAGAHPLYVEDIGRHFETVREPLAKLGLPIKKPSYLRWDVFLTEKQHPGATGLGGPVYLHHDLPSLAVKDKLPVDDVIRATVAHEAAHLGQTSYAKTLGGSIAAQAFMEASGTYVGDIVWRTLGQPTEITRDFYLKDPVFPSTPLPKAGDPTFYAWGNFFRYLDQQGGNAGEILLRAVNESGDVSLQGIDAQVQAHRIAFGGGGLPDVFADFAKDFFHDDLWDADLAPALHGSPLFRTLVAHGPADTGFTIAAAALHPASGTQKVNVAASVTVPGSGPLTAQARYVMVNPLPRARKAKLAIAIETGSDGVKTWRHSIAADEGDPAASVSGAPAKFEREFGSLDTAKALFEDVGTPDGPSMFTFVSVNRSLSFAASSYTIHRWLLLAPSFVRARPVPGKSGTREVTWEPSELRNATGRLQDGSRYFKEYRVYRKPRSAPDTAWELRKAVTDGETWIDPAVPESESWVYTVRVVDAHDNESADGLIDENAFVGTWDGTFALVDGSLVEPIAAWGEREMAKKKDVDPEARKLWGEIVSLMEGMEEAARLGIPFTLEIREDAEGYRGRLTHILMQPITDTGEQNQGARFRRIDATTIELYYPPAKTADEAQARRDLGQMFPPIQLKLCHQDPREHYYEIREDGYVMWPEIDGKVARCKIRWAMTKRPPGGT